MQKIEVVARIANETGIPKNDVVIVIDKLFDTIINNVNKGEQIHFRGFGSFLPHKKKAKIARNISTNTAINLKETHIPIFRPSENFVKKIKETFSSLTMN